MNVKLSAKVSIKSRQDSETPFLLTFELTNKGDADVNILKIGTPLEGLYSDCFDVVRDDEHVPYDGPLVKRAAPTKKDYVRIRPGDSAVSEVDLSACYQVSVPGKYEVTFRGSLPDVATQAEMRAKAKTKDAAQFPVVLKVRSKKFTVRSGKHGRATSGEAARRQDEDTPSETAKVSKRRAKRSSPKPPTLINGTATQKSQAKKAHEDGYKLTVAALSGLSNNAKYKEWFGTYTPTRFAKVKEVYTKISDGMKNKTFTYDLSGTGCKPDWYAYTYKNTTKIWFCSAFWSAPATGTDSKAGTVLHEHSHASALTDDIQYGQAACRQLAIDNPNSAVKNADNFEYYAGG